MNAAVTTTTLPPIAYEAAQVMVIGALLLKRSIEDLAFALDPPADLVERQNYVAERLAVWQALTELYMELLEITAAQLQQCDG